MGAPRCESSNPQLVGNGLTYQVIGPDHQNHLFYESIKGCEKLGEGSERCFKGIEDAHRYMSEHVEELLDLQKY